ncbi:hypothetical protein L3X38_028980 [Prunus dulcis]|uniref:Uncharacterized protein n=1 Tax=Prunus dulcis TaxID=3755 RepID=A0AAD4VQZ8_PRUDU|nr:hypothetical protein L3X38_028980 [Prunus dulcis]
MFTSAKWLRNAAKINALKVKYVSCPNQQVGVIVAKVNPADLKRIGVVSSSNGSDSSGEKRILLTFNSRITALGLFLSLLKRGPKETLLAFAEHEDAKWSRPTGCGFTATEWQNLRDCIILLQKRVKPDLSTEMGPRPTAPSKVPLVPVVKSRSGPGGEDAKKPENGNGGVAKPSREGANGGEDAKKPENGDGGVAKPSREGANGGGHNGKQSEGGNVPSNGKPYSGVVAGDEGGNGAGATEGAGEGGILEKLLEKLHDIFGG